MVVVVVVLHLDLLLRMTTDKDPDEEEEEGLNKTSGTKCSTRVEEVTPESVNK